MALQSVKMVYENSALIPVLLMSCQTKQLPSLETHFLASQLTFKQKQYTVCWYSNCKVCLFKPYLFLKRYLIGAACVLISPMSSSPAAVTASSSRRSFMRWPIRSFSFDYFHQHIDTDSLNKKNCSFKTFCFILICEVGKRFSQNRTLCCCKGKKMH